MQLMEVVMNKKPDVMGFFDKDTATWSYVVWDATVAMLLTQIVFTILYRGEMVDYEG